ncbi:MAG: hypothetical protein HOE80_01310 [Candidatus Magasanikbacteria bacterium]|nr:hypothetical protein [Candidatus Magasanikbacteria bacterium]MBT4071340.1 hypothetical protein [Candidatus Magasanikbacteria bacterium]
MSEIYIPPIEKEQPPYWEHIRKAEQELFPEFETEDFCIDSPETNNFYFAPNWHFREGLITEEDIEHFKKNTEQKILSIGSGPAYLERLLVSLDIPKENITLSDINPQDLPDDFEKETFNMLEKWPTLNNEEKFDLIIFPENPSINVNFSGQKRIQAFVHIFSEALKNLNPDETIRITGNPNSTDLTKKVEKMLIKAGYPVIVQNITEKQDFGSLITVNYET